MDLIKYEDFRLTERNKALANMYFNYNNTKVKAEFIFYLQRDECLGIRVGRHDATVPTQELKQYVHQNKLSLQRMVKPDVVRVKEERLRKLMQEDN